MATNVGSGKARGFIVEGYGGGVWGFAFSKFLTYNIQICRF